MQTAIAAAAQDGKDSRGAPTRHLVCVIAFAMALVTAGCATSETPTNQQRAAEPDLTGAHLDKRKFLLGISMLGKSVKQDIELLHKMTGHTFNPREDSVVLADGSKQFRESTRLSGGSPMLIGGGYRYSISPAGLVRTSANFVFNTKVECITVEDLEAVLGKPSQYEFVGGIRKGTGPSHIYGVIYHHSSGARSYFAYTTALCANDMVQSSANEQGRSQ